MIAILDHDEYERLLTVAQKLPSDEAEGQVASKSSTPDLTPQN